jgi:2-acylglycerol O-acyltransferase 2
MIKKFLAHKFVILLPIACILINIVFLFFYIFCGWFYIPYLLWIILWDRQTHETGGRNNVDWFRQCRILKYFKDYFPASMTPIPNIHGPCIYGVHPHGVISMVSWTTLLPNTDIRIATLTSNFYIPVFRELLLSFGFVSVSKKSILHCLKQHKSVAIVVGGAEEALCITKGLILDKRKGFIEIALRTGTPLVPVYNFGETELYNTYENNHVFQKVLKRVLGCTLPIVFNIFPKRVPIKTVFGEAIMVQKMDNPSKEDVNRVHGQYKEALMELYKKNGQGELKIIL